jgi:hypothetical protein
MNVLLSSKKLLEAREHGKFAETGWYQLYPKNLNQWEQPKIMLPYMVTQLSAYFDDAENYFVNVTTGGFGVTVSEQHGSGKYFTGLLNSSLLDWFLKRVSTTFHGGYYAANKQFIERLPIPTSDEKQRQVVETLVDHLLWLHRQPSVNQSDRNHPQDPLIASYFEQTVNALVYELFFPQELHAADVKFFELATTTPIAKPTNPPASAAGLEWYREQFKKLSAPGHPLRVALDKLQTLDLVRILEGLA